MKIKHSHYFKDVSAYDYITISDVLKLWNCENKHQKKIVKHIFNISVHHCIDVDGLEKIDIYRLSDLLKINSPCHHILKKALAAGQRGHKDLETDVQNIIDTAKRAVEMMRENQENIQYSTLSDEFDEKLLKKIIKSAGKWLASLQSEVQENDPPDWVYDIPAGGVQCKVSHYGLSWFDGLVLNYDSNSEEPYITKDGPVRYAKPIAELNQ